METKNILLIILGVLIFASIFFGAYQIALVLIVLTAVGIVAYLLMEQSKKYVDPIEQMKVNLYNEAYVQQNQLNNLILEGDHKHQRKVLGKVRGYTIMRYEKEKPVNENGIINAEEHADDVPEQWKTLYCIIYHRHKTGLATILSKIIPSMNKPHYFLANKEQIFNNNDLTIGDVIIKGTAITTIGFYEALNTVDLDKDYIAHLLNLEAKRITLLDVVSDLPMYIGKAAKGDETFVKMKGLLGNEKAGFGIKNEN